MSELIKLPSLEALPEVASRVLSYLKESKFFIFKGEMGAGKTTLIKEMCKQLEIIDNISSPTYSIVNEYRSSNEEKIFHFDFYRIEDPA
ncbi:MAG: tRNA (adenosine(37)-N6)-threonylcarbamoyltransferase complex ATPase subunit type 1 TsaE, partial [Flavobacteriales bacterium]|nr:tRNA (adenosine(37)-N6)-threonylcarbamoyltransferase complex ATPase subunit type 1 TsaE [Flavobacteriales bacterium]